MRTYHSQQLEVLEAWLLGCPHFYVKMLFSILETTLGSAILVYTLELACCNIHRSVLLIYVTYYCMQAQIYEMYQDGLKAFGGHHFEEFRHLCEYKQEQIHVVWEVDMNEGEEILAYSYGDMRIPAQYDDKPMTRGVWASLVADVKAECACKSLHPLQSQKSK